MKIRGVEAGTLVDGKNLCLSCRHATVIRGASEKHQIIECAQLGYYDNRINFKVLECGDYSDKTRPSRSDMEQIAWVIVTDKKKNSIGFVSPKEFKANKERYDKHGVIDPDY